MANTQALIAQAYSAFNQRNVDGALALMSENVSWPKASERWSCGWERRDSCLLDPPVAGI